MTTQQLADFFTAAADQLYNHQAHVALLYGGAGISFFCAGIWLIFWGGHLEFVLPRWLRCLRWIDGRGADVALLFLLVGFSVALGVGTSFMWCAEAHSRKVKEAKEKAEAVVAVLGNSETRVMTARFLDGGKLVAIIGYPSKTADVSVGILGDTKVIPKPFLDGKSVEIDKATIDFLAKNGIVLAGKLQSAVKTVPAK